MTRRDLLRRSLGVFAGTLLVSNLQGDTTAAFATGGEVPAPPPPAPLPPMLLAGTPEQPTHFLHVRCIHDEAAMLEFLKRHRGFIHDTVRENVRSNLLRGRG